MPAAGRPDGRVWNWTNRTRAGSRSSSPRGRWLSSGASRALLLRHRRGRVLPLREPLRRCGGARRVLHAQEGQGRPQRLRPLGRHHQRARDQRPRCEAGAKRAHDRPPRGGVLEAVALLAHEEPATPADGYAPAPPQAHGEGDHARQRGLGAPPPNFCLSYPARPTPPGIVACRPWGMRATLLPG